MCGGGENSVKQEVECLVEGCGVSRFFKASHMTGGGNVARPVEACVLLSYFTMYIKINKEVVK